MGLDLRLRPGVVLALASACAPPLPEAEAGGATEISGAQSLTTTTTGTDTGAPTSATATTTDAVTTGEATEGATTTTGAPAGYCGDKILQAGEACDDGSGNGKTAACLPDCTKNVCGDGHVLFGVEGCDDGPDNADDAACTSACTKNVCGDGHRLEFIEGCDDGEANGDDAACTSACKPAKCGDGLVWAGVEECDDADNHGGDGCTPECRRENVVFVTEAVFPGDLGGVAGADAICRDAAKLSPLLPWPDDAITYRAWIADPTCAPRDRLPHSKRPYVRVDGIPIADGWDDLVDGALAVNVACTEHHNYLYEQKDALAWTAARADGSNLADLPSRTCNGWTLSGDFFFGAVGRVNSADSQWSRRLVDGADAPLGCHQLAHVYCVQIHCDEFPEACAPDYCGA